MQTITLLKELGFNEKEAKIYISLLELGEATLKNIADNSLIPRTSLYTPVKTLIKKGLIEFYKRKGRNYYVAVTPERFLHLEQAKIKLLDENLFQLKAGMGIGVSAPKIRFFEGKDGIKLLLDEILNEKRPFRAITSIEDMNRIAGDYFKNFIRNRIQQNLHVDLLTNRSSEAQVLKSTDAQEQRETRFVPARYNFNTANYIFGNKVAMISLKQEPIVGILIEDKSIAQTQNMFFDLIWKMASSK